MIEWVNSSSPNVKSLQLRFRCSKCASRVEISPLLKKLVIKVVLLGKRNYNEENDDQGPLWASDTEIYDGLQEKLPMSFVLQLRTVEVTLVEADNIFPFLEFLLKNASKLEKIVFRVKEIKQIKLPSRAVNCLLRAAQKLLKMPRSSRTAQFTFSEY